MEGIVQCGNVKLTEGKLAVRGMVIVRRNTDLLEVIGTLRAPGGA